MKPLRHPFLLLGLLSLGLLTGCAAQRAYQQGQALITQGQTEAGLAKIERAAQLDPDSPDYRLALVKEKSRYTAQLCAQGDAARQAGEWERAGQAYRLAAAQSARLDCALDGLRATDRERRRANALAAAQSAVDKKDLAGARAMLHALLLESPDWAPATALLRRIEVAAANPAAPTQVELGAGYKQPISLDFKDAPLRTIFSVISRTSGLNILFDKDVKTDQRASIYLRDSSIEAAIDWLLLTNQLEQRVLDRNTLLIYPATPAKQQQYQPLQVRSFYLANADAKAVANSLHTLLKSKNVVVDDKLNLIVVKDTPDAIKLAEKIIALHDIPDAEVMLEVEVLEVSRERLLNLGIAWPDQVALTPLPTTAGNALTLEDLRHAHYANAGVSVGDATINVKKQDNDTHILANPRIRVRNHEKAKIMIGEKVPNVSSTLTPTGVVSESVAYLDVGLKLDAEPTIYLDNEVSIKLGLEVSSITSTTVTKNGTTTYQIGSRDAQTVLRLRDGENQILAGLINAQEQGSADKLPGLGDLPIIGRLFGSQSTDNTRTEIILSITPHIIRNVQRPDADVLEFDAGTEDSLRAWPKDLVLDANARADAGAPRGALPGDAGSDAAPDKPAPRVETPGVAAAVAERPVRLRWIAPSQAAPGDTIAAQLWIESKTPLMAVPLVAEFDPNVLEVVSVTEGPFLGTGGAPTSFQPSVAASGQVTLNATRTAASPANAPGVLANFVFRVKPGAKAARTQVQVLPVAARDADGHLAPADPPAPLAFRLGRTAP